MSGQRLEIRGEYPPDWRELSLQVKMDADFRCVRCHHPFGSDGAPFPCDARCDKTRGKFEPGAIYARRHDVRGLNYGVHHLDGDKSNSRWWNLLAMCNSCHLRVQARVIPERVFLFDHSEWFIPFVCGFYAWYYAKIEITRAQALESRERWLAYNPARL